MAINPNKPKMVVEQGPLTAFLDELPGLLYQFKRQQWDYEEAARVRDWESGEKEKQRIWQEEQTFLDREHDKTMLHVEDQIADLNDAIKRKNTLIDQGMEMGLVPGEDMTLDGASIVDNELGAVDHDIKALSQAIGQFQRGNYLAKTIDALGDGSGHVEQWEIDNYLKQNDIEIDSSMKKGIEAWTLDPERRVAIQQGQQSLIDKQLDIKKKEIELEYLPDHLRILQEKGELEVKTSLKNLDIMDKTSQQLILQNEQIAVNTENQRLQIDALAQRMEQEDVAFDLEKITQGNEATSQMLVQNLELQQLVGNQLFSKIVVEDINDNFTPLYAAIAEGQDVTAVINKMGAVDSSIKADLLSLVEGLQVGKGDEMIPDFALVLNQLGTIQKGVAQYQDWFNKNKSAITMLANEHGDSLEEFQSKLLNPKTAKRAQARLLKLAGDDYVDQNIILKALSWKRTGILDDSQLLTRANAVTNQYRDLNALEEQWGMLKINYTQSSIDGPYPEVDNILAPFEFINTRSRMVGDTTQDDIDDIFRKE